MDGVGEPMADQAESRLAERLAGRGKAAPRSRRRKIARGLASVRARTVSRSWCGAWRSLARRSRGARNGSAGNDERADREGCRCQHLRDKVSARLGVPEAPGLEP